MFWVFKKKFDSQIKKFCLKTINKKLCGSFDQKLTTPQVIKSLNVDA